MMSLTKGLSDQISTSACWKIRTDREQVEPPENDAGRGEDREGELEGVSQLRRVSA